MTSSTIGWGRWGLALAFCAAVLLPAHAGPGQDKKTGGSNPTNTAIVDSDLMVAPTDSYTFGTVADVAAPLYSPELELLLSQPAAAQIRAVDAHQFATGRGVVVAVLDGGFNVHHPAIANNMLAMGYDAVDGDYDVNDFGNGFDDDGDGIVDGTVGHGTFVASMILMAAPRAEILPVRVRDDEGYGTNADLVRGIEYAMDMGADVINLSVTQAVAMKKGVWRTIYKAQRQGIVFVVSAGNEGQDQVIELATSSDMLAVGAVDAFDRLADFSNYSEGSFSTMICAPGVDVYGAMGVDAFGFWSGTSFSTGIMSGAAALLLERHPEYSLQQACAALDDATDPTWHANGDLFPAGGRINLLTLVTR